MTGEDLFRRISGCINPTCHPSLVDRMALHYQTMQLSGAHGTWKSPRLQNHAHLLLPSSITYEDGINFLKQMLERLTTLCTDDYKALEECRTL